MAYLRSYEEKQLEERGCNDGRFSIWPDRQLGDRYGNDKQQAYMRGFDRAQKARRERAEEEEAAERHAARMAAERRHQVEEEEYYQSEREPCGPEPVESWSE